MRPIVVSRAGVVAMDVELDGKEIKGVKVVPPEYEMPSQEEIIRAKEEYVATEVLWLN